MRRIWFLVILVSLLILVLAPMSASAQFPHGFAGIQHRNPKNSHHSAKNQSPAAKTRVPPHLKKPRQRQAKFDPWHHQNARPQVPDFVRKPHRKESFLDPSFSGHHAFPIML